MKRARRSHTAEFKAQVALASLRRDRPVALQAHQFDVHPNLVRAWRSHLVGRAALLFDEPRKSSRR